MGSYGTASQYEESTLIHPALRKGIAVYHGAKALLGALSPEYDELSKVVSCNPTQTRPLCWLSFHTQRRGMWYPYQDAAQRVCLLCGYACAKTLPLIKRGDTLAVR